MTVADLLAELEGTDPSTELSVALHGGSYVELWAGGDLLGGITA